MPIYEFRNEKGEYTDRYYTVGESPLLFSWVDIDGQKWQRIPSKPRNVIKKDYEFRSMQERRWDPDAPEHVPRGQKFEGAPVFRSKRQIDEFVAKKRHKENRELVWGEGSDNEL